MSIKSFYQHQTRSDLTTRSCVDCFFFFFFTFPPSSLSKLVAQVLAQVLLIRLSWYPGCFAGNQKPPIVPEFSSAHDINLLSPHFASTPLAYLVASLYVWLQSAHSWTQSCRNLCSAGIRLLQTYAWRWVSVPMEGDGWLLGLPGRQILT